MSRDHRMLLLLSAWRRRSRLEREKLVGELQEWGEQHAAKVRAEVAEAMRELAVLKSELDRVRAASAEPDHCAALH